MENTAKNFALQFGAIVALYVSVWSLITLLFGIVNITLPDVVQDNWYYSNETDQIRYSIAALVVFFPTYLFLTRHINTVRRNEHGVYLALTKWVIYLSLVLGGGLLLGNLVTLINGFLNGELTLRFGLKVFAFFAVIGSAFAYYTLDAQSYWQTNEKKSKLYGLIMSVIVLASIIGGYRSIESPGTVTEMRIDEQQVQDLIYLESLVTEYYRNHEVIPEQLSELPGSEVGGMIPTASDNGSAYLYKKIDANTYKLCATFKQSSIAQDQKSRPMPDINWEHPAGEWCFERSVKKW